MSDRFEKLVEYYEGDELAARVMSEKYLQDDENLPEDMWRRVANAVASVEEYPKQQAELYFNLLSDFKFIPGGRIMYGAGIEKKVTLSNCYYIPIKEDSIEGIYNWLKESALTYRGGGGVGVDISILRPKGKEVKNSGGVSPGAFSFMDLMSKSTQTVHQKSRRGALMISMNVHHPDILDFINVKSTPGMVEHANISVMLTDDFMQAVRDNEKYEQRWPVDSDKPEIRKKISAKKIWNEIIKNAHAHAEPGILFCDNHAKDDVLSTANPAKGTNPCSEIWLGNYGNCNLSHMNLSKYINDDGTQNLEALKSDVYIAIQFLDGVIDYNAGSHALLAQEKFALAERRLGLGVTGLADALIKMKLKYYSPEAIEATESFMFAIRDAAFSSSIDLAIEKGAYSSFNFDEWSRSSYIQRMAKVHPSYYEQVKKHGIRNSFLMTCAPVGSGSIIAQVSSGIEPIFATSYLRKVRSNETDKFREFKTYPKIIQDLFGSDENLPDYVVTSHNIDPNIRVEMQAAIQKYVDNSISSTINIKKDSPVEMVANIYMEAWLNGLKGVTVYREGSRDGILITEDEKESEETIVDNRLKNKKRPITLKGCTYKIPSGPDEKLYITINPDPENSKRPYEVFISTFGADNPQLQTITVLLSALLKNINNGPDFIIEDLRKIESSQSPVWWHDVEAGRRHQINSVPRAVAIALEKFIEDARDEKKEKIEYGENMSKCPKCFRQTYVVENGCSHCIECGYEKCS